MFLHPHLADAKPLIVAGIPRCGTRFVANSLNQHPRVHLNGEIPLPMMKRAAEMLRVGDELYARMGTQKPGRSHGEGWRVNRRALLYAHWGALPKHRPMRPLERPVAFFGHKTPNHDELWPFYRDFLGADAVRWVFCVRSFAEHHISRQTLGARSIERVGREYRASLNRLADMQEALGDRVVLFVLDDLKVGGHDYLVEHLFAGLGLEVDERTADRLQPARAANTSAERGFARRGLTTEEQTFLDRNEDLLGALEVARAGGRIAPNNAGEQDETDTAPAEVTVSVTAPPPDEGRSRRWRLGARR